MPKDNCNEEKASTGGDKVSYIYPLYSKVRRRLRSSTLNKSGVDEQRNARVGADRTILPNVCRGWSDLKGMMYDSAEFLQ